MVQTLAQVEHSFVQRQPAQRGPQVERIAASAARKTVKQILAEMDGKGAAGRRARPVQRARATPLRAVPAERLIADQRQHVGQAQLCAGGAIVEAGTGSETSI